MHCTSNDGMIAWRFTRTVEVTLAGIVDGREQMERVLALPMDGYAESGACILACAVIQPGTKSAGPDSALLS